MQQWLKMWKTESQADRVETLRRYYDFSLLSQDEKNLRFVGGRGLFFIFFFFVRSLVSNDENQGELTSQP